jgi:SAM-dependent methyltransferase
MKNMIAKHLDSLADTPLHVLDVGSYDVNGTFRSALPAPWHYTGCDIRSGPNVDIVMSSPERIQDQGYQYDVVICGATLEHVIRPWRLVPEMARMLKADGVLLVSVPWQWEMHDHPCDYWRVLPEGLRLLFSDAGLTVLDVYAKDNFTHGAARRA